MAIEVFEVTDTQSVQQPSHFPVYILHPAPDHRSLQDLWSQDISNGEIFTTVIKYIEYPNAISSSVDEIITFTQFLLLMENTVSQTFCSNALYITVFYQSR